MIDEEIEKLKQTAPDARELTRAMNQIEASFFRRMERTGSFGGKADQMNGYYFATGMPDFFEEDLARYRAISATDVQAAAHRFLPEGSARGAHRHGGEVIMAGRGLADRDESVPGSLGLAGLGRAAFSCRSWPC